MLVFDSEVLCGNMGTASGGVHARQHSVACISCCAYGAVWAAALGYYCTLSCAYCDRCRDARMSGFVCASAAALLLLLLLLFTEDF
jgi:hypothetical protein